MKLDSMRHILAGVLFVATLHAQNIGGTLRGSVQDSTGARIVSAQIAIHSMSSAVNRSVASDARGEFRIEDISPGTYKLSIAASGFSPASAYVSIEVNTTRDVAVVLKPPRVQQTAGVQAENSSIATQTIDLASQVHQSVVTERDLEFLPLAARSFANVAYLAPGTEPVEPSDPTKARITAVSTGGSSGLNNELSVDGADNSDDYIGGFLQNFSPDAIQEFSIRTAQEDADTGGTTAASIVITTRRGSDDWHGAGAFYERAAALNSRFPIENPAPDPKQPFSRQNYVGALGGPIKRDKLWFFAAMEHVHENASIVYSPANAAQFEALASLAGRGLIPGVDSITVPSNVAIPFRDYFGSLRLDWSRSQKSSWFLRGSADTYITRNALVAQAALPSTGLINHTNYLNIVVGNEYLFSGSWVGRILLGGSGLHLTQNRNSNLGFALAFPFSSTTLTVSGFETFGDNQFATPITFFPSRRSQEKYQFRYDITGAEAHHAVRFGVNLIHEPVLTGAFPGNTETLYQFPQNPRDYLSDTAQFTADMGVGQSTSSLGGSVSQNVQRLAFYAQDSWRVAPRLTLNYGIRYSTTYGLFRASGKSQLLNPALITLRALRIPLASGVPHDDREQVAPRLGVAYSPGRSGTTVIRAGFGMYFNDLAQGGWIAAFQGVDAPSGFCVDPVQNPGGAENSGCIAGSTFGGIGNLIAPNYRTPYALHASAGFQHSFGADWSLSADYTHEQGNHGYRGYGYVGGDNLFTPLLSASNPSQADLVPDLNVFHSDNRSSYDALMIHLQGNVSRRVELITNYTLAAAKTWGCVLGELFDYVNGVCDPLNAFGPGDYGPSGEDVRHRFVFAGTWRAPGGIEISTLTQAESARPFTITTADNSGRISIKGTPTGLDQFRGTPYVQADLRVSRPIALGDHWSLRPFAEIFNLFNRNNPGANYVTNVASLPVPSDQAQAGNVTDVCVNSGCTAIEPIKSAKQLGIPAGGLGDFFGPGTTVGIPFAAQFGVRIIF